MKGLVLSTILVSGLFFLTQNAFAENLFYGTSSFEKLPSIISDKPSTIELKIWYTEGPDFMIKNLTPVFDVSPKNAKPYVLIDTNLLDGLYRNGMGRIQGTISIDPQIPYEKIFVSVYFNGTDEFGNPYKSAWADSATINIKKQTLIHTANADDFVNTPKEDIPIGRSPSAFSFNIRDHYIVGSHAHLVVQKGNSANIPIQVKNISSQSYNFTFYPTIGSQTEPPPMPRGIKVQLEPNHVALQPGEETTLNLIVNADNDAPSKVYDVGLVGVWEEPNGFMGSSIRLHVGKYFGADAIPDNFDIGTPLQLYKNGVLPKDILCKNGYVVAIKSSNSQPACVEPESLQRLLRIGWADQSQNIERSKSFSYETVSIQTSKSLYSSGEGFSAWLNVVANHDDTGIELMLPQLEYPLIPQVCGIPYYNLAVISGNHRDEIDSFEDLVSLKEQIINIENTNSHGSCLLAGPQQFMSVMLSEPTKNPYTKEQIVKMLDQGYDAKALLAFVDANPDVLDLQYSNATVRFVAKSGGFSSFTYSMFRFFGNVTQYYDKFETKEKFVSPYDNSIGWNVYVANHPLKPGNYTLVGFTMSGSISKPIVIGIEK